MMIALRYLIESLTILLLLLASGCHTYKDTEGYGPASKASSTGVWRFDFNDRDRKSVV